MNNIVIGIEGQVASGKTSICKELVNIIPNSIFIDGGNIYRGIVEALALAHIEPTKMGKDLDPLEIMKKLKVEFKIENKMTEIYIAGNKISEDIIQNAHNAVEVSKMANTSDNSHLFTFARNIIEQYKQKYNIIVSARELLDIYPNMDCHVFVTASLEERTKRRYAQYNGKYTVEEITKMIESRDKLHEQSGFNKKGAKTITVDVTESKNAKEAAEKILKTAKEKGLINL